jgi:hypothetical protein
VTGTGPAAASTVTVRAETAEVMSRSLRKS